MTRFEERTFIPRCKCETHRRFEGYEDPAFDLRREIHQLFHDWESLDVPFGRHHELARCATDR